MKKTLKITSISILIIMALLLVIPFAFQGQIKTMVKNFINNNLNANVEFSDVNLSFFRDFPNAHINVSNLVITNFEPFKDETLATAKDIAFSMPVKELFKTSSGDPIVVNAIEINEALLTLKTNKFGNDNYDILIEKENAATDSTYFSFDLKNYEINKSALTYIDEASDIIVHISELNHQGKGLFSANQSELQTTSDAHLSITIDSTNYLDNNAVKLDALIGLDLTNYKYTFKENKGYINQLPLEFTGYVQMLDDGQDIDISFENPSSSFKHFLAVIPEAYSKNIENVETSGDFKIKGLIKGQMTNNTIPTLDINVTSNNASFKYPDLPKRVDNISINMGIKNTTGNADDTYIDIETLNFKIDEDVFKSSATLRNLTKNMLVDATVDGTLNLANLSQAYPIDLEQNLTGILKGKINTAFDMNAIETNAYSRIKSDGYANVSNVTFANDAFNMPMQISEANMTLNAGNVNLKSFKAKTGESDISATGTITNLLGFMFSDNTLKGNFTLNSNVFKVSDFMTEEEATGENKATNKTSESLKIPAFLDCTVSAYANTVIYDDLKLQDVKGVISIKDEQVALRDVTSSLFDGTLALAGDVIANNDVSKFNLNLVADQFDISKSFNELELLQNLAPVARILQGKLNTSIGLSGNLNDDFSLDLSSVSGKALAELLTTSISANQSKVLSKLGGALSFIDFDRLDLKDLKTQLEFSNGQVSVKPFQFKYKDIVIDVFGTHGFDKTMNYNAVFNIPASYLGSEVNRLIGKIDTEEANTISIPVTAIISGTYNNPNVSTDLTSGVANLTKQLIEIEKQKLIDQGKDKVKGMLGDIISGNKNKSDSIMDKEKQNPIKEVFVDILKGNKAQTDSTQVKKADTTSASTQEGLRKVLGALIRNRAKKDTIN
ncbi:AsmA-like C-terminal region-containing protein [Changchengzhania lutea]|uniref:AsmA-like C-terminal region-containing protein n=1 Tax=Changchengzhania lutea TaxID=2049305 RepID=UPI00115C9D25|nr:AsmA-like C-terminal region-containing protein [Changchengzhania lutea]